MAAAASSAQLVPCVYYFAQRQLFGHLKRSCEEEIARRGNDPLAAFWRAVAVASEGNPTEAIRELDGLRRKREVEFAAMVALIDSHKRCKLVQHDVVAALEADLSAAHGRATEVALVAAAMFQWIRGDFSTARRHLSDAFRANPDSTPALCLQGWLDLTFKPKGTRDLEVIVNSVNHFSRVLESAKHDLAALLGVARYHEVKRKYTAALDPLNQAIAVHPWFLPALCEKARLLTLSGDWDQASETVRRVLERDRFSVEGQSLAALIALVREGRLREASNALNELLAALDRHEPRNAKLYLQCSKPFARVADRNERLLRVASTMIERAQAIDPECSEYFSEHGYQLALMRDWAAAMTAFTRASQLDEGNLPALQGVIQCQIMTGKLDDAEQQLEFLSVIQESIGGTAELSYLQALLRWRKHADQERHLAMLNQALTQHWKDVKSSKAAPNSLQWLAAFNPHFLLQIAEEYLVHCGTEPKGMGEATPSHLAKAVALLEKVTSHIPGLHSAQLLLARALFVDHNFAAATEALQRCLSLDSSSSTAHLIKAQIALASEDFGAANDSLGQAVSHDFQVRTSPVYHLIQARVLEAKNDLEGAFKVLDAAMRLPGVRRKAGTEAGVPAISQHDRASLFIMMADVLNKLNRLPEATKTVQDAMHAFAGTPEEVRVLIANSELALRQGDVDAAVGMLGTVQPGSSAFAKAQQVRAHIYLHHRGDKRKYVRCFEELLESNPAPHNYVLLSDALMRVQRPDEAIEALEKALALSPDDATLTCRIGRALIATHEFARAVEYYTRAVAQNPDRMQLRLELATLLKRMQRFDEAASVLQEAAASAMPSEGDSAALRERADLLLLLAEVHKGAGKPDAAVDALQQARALQRSLLSRSGVDAAKRDKAQAAAICFELAVHTEEQVKDAAAAEALYSEALSLEDTHEPSLLRLARLARRRDDAALCRERCMVLLRLNPGNTEASTMLADLLLQAQEHDMATERFQQLVEARPENFTALFQLVQLLQRAGKLDSAPRYLQQAERASPQAGHRPGFRCCKGLYFRYRNDPHQAIQLFNLARRDGEWGRVALTNMIEIYLNPDNECLWADTEGKGEVYLDGIRTAQSLLREAPLQPKAKRTQVLECYTLLLSRARQQMELGMQELMGMLQADRDYVPATVALCTGFMLQKNSAKARNLLKRLSKMPFEHEYADDFERAYLMLADVYVESAKYDLAQELCERALKINNSSSKALEFLGLIFEKEASYQDASDCYERAWRLQQGASAAIGFKLAFNYLKARRFVEAIDVCHQVLAKFPDYPRLRKEILEKAQAQLRV